MATVKFKLNDIECRKVTSGGGADDVYAVILARDPATRQVHARFSAVWEFNSGESRTVNHVFAPVVTLPNAAAVEWSIAVRERDGGVDSPDLEQAAAIAFKQGEEILEKLPESLDWRVMLLVFTAKTLHFLISEIWKGLDDELIGEQHNEIPIVDGRTESHRLVGIGDGAYYVVDYEVETRA